MASEDLLVLAGMPENYRLGGQALHRLPEAHPKVQVEIVHDREKFAQRLPNADGAIIARYFHFLTAEDLSPNSLLRWVQNASAGMDGFMTPELMAADHVALTATKGPSGPLLAEHTVMLMLALARNLPAYLKNQENRLWQREGHDWPPMHGKTIAILGVGGGGSVLARLCQVGLGMKVLGLSRIRRDCPNVDQYFGREDLPNMLSQADVVALCLPATPETTNIINTTALAAMKPTAYLINIARGELIDEGALAEALTKGRLAGAGLDVTSNDPLPADSPLWDCPNLIITPHVAIGTQQISDDVVDFWSENIRRFAEGEPLLGLVDRQAGY